MARQYAYIYTDPINYEHFYVGKGKNDRAYRHLAPKGSTNPLVKERVNKIRVCGLSPIVTVIETSNHEFALMLEKGLIKAFGRKDIGAGTLYNFTSGGQGTVDFRRREESNKKTSESLKEFYKGFKIIKSKDSIQKMIETKRKNPTGTGKWMHNDETRTKVKPEDVQKYLDSGWKLGLGTKHITEEYRAKLRNKTVMQWQKLKAIGHGSNLVSLNGVQL